MSTSMVSADEYKHGKFMTRTWNLRITFEIKSNFSTYFKSKFNPKDPISCQSDFRMYFSILDSFLFLKNM